MLEGLFIAATGAVVVASNAPMSHAAGLGLLSALLIFFAIGWGMLVAQVCRFQLTQELHLLLGFSLIAYGLGMPVLLLGISILVPALLVPIGTLGFLRRQGQIKENGAWWLCLIAAAGFALIWSLEISNRFQEFLAGGRFRLWADAFIHAGTIAEFGDPRSVGRGSIALAGVPGVIYHAISHAIGGIAIQLTGIGPLDVISAFWLPLGILLTTIGVFTLGRALAGISGGALALLFLAILPDAAGYGLRQGFLSFHWMMETSPGSLYALPVALASIALLVRWTRDGHISILLVSASLLGAVFFLRAHIFVWLLVPWAVTFWLALPWPERRVRWALLLLGCLGAPAALLWIARAELESVGLFHYLVRYIVALHGNNPPTAYDGLYPWLSFHLGHPAAMPLGLVLALFGMAGAWLVTFLIGIAWAGWRSRLQTADIFPVALLLWAMALMVLAPTPFHGDYTDFRQRGFVLVYAVLMIWSAHLALLLLPPLARPKPLALAACLSLAATLQWMPDAKRPRMAWSANLIDRLPRPGIVEAGHWVGQLAEPGDSFLFSDQLTDENLIDDATVVLGISGVPAWLSRPGIMRAAGPPRSTAAADRLARTATINAQTDRGNAFAQLQAAGVGFYLAPLSAPPAWDPEGLHADFRAGDMLGWRVPRRILR